MDRHSLVIAGRSHEVLAEDARRERAKRIDALTVDHLRCVDKRPSKPMPPEAQRAEQWLAFRRNPEAVGERLEAMRRLMRTIAGDPYPRPRR